MMKVGVISDSHGQLDERILELLTHCDLVVHGGDIGHAGVLATLRSVCARVVAVRGNNDTSRRWPANDQNELKQLKNEEIINLPGGKLVLVHGHHAGAPAQRHQRLRAMYTQARAVVYGHSHRLVEDLDQEPWILNPGACGRSRTFGGPSCQVLVVQRSGWHVTSHRFPLPARIAPR